MSFNKNINPINTPFSEYIPILIFIGIIGTIISIIDPFGRLVKYIILVVENYKELSRSKKTFFSKPFQRFVKAIYIKYLKINRIENRKKENNQRKETPYMDLLRYLNTSWINYEIDKLVSTFYFIIALIFLIYILGNPIHFDTYIKFVSFNLNSSNTNDNTIGIISDCNAIEDSKEANNIMDLYCEIRIPFFIGFILSLIVLIIVFFYSCNSLSNKIKTLKDYYEVTEAIDRNKFPDVTRTELNNLDKNFLDSLNAHDWGLAEEFLNRLVIVAERQEDGRINPSV